MATPARAGLRRRRGLAAVAVVAVLIIVDLIIVGIVLGLARDHELTVRAQETVEALYAAEAGASMAMRELVTDVDEDGDGGVGTIANTSVGNATVVVTVVSSPPLTTLTVTGASGQARRRIEVVVADPS